ncbi:MAG: hypothetical protein Q4F95_02285 [Oscillospiraceae bacterium]|nr:hypothetical protein [Oscillospiraceae bacterium]
MDSPYECKRTKNLIKVKEFYTCDLKCIGVEEGKTDSTKGTVGALILDYKGNPTGCSGFKADFAKYYWEHPEEIIGKIIEVRYKEQTSNKQGGESIQFAKFVCIREDKTEESYS